MNVIQADDQIDKYLQDLDCVDTPYVRINDIDGITLDDYLKPLNVRWLCSCCHKQWHRDNGEGLNG